MFLDVVKTGLTVGRSMDSGPTGWYVDVLRPERILAFVVYQCQIGGVFVLEWISHRFDGW